MARADGDPWRRQLRVAFVKKDLKTLRELAQGETASAQPPATSLLLGRVLKELADTELAADILRRAQEEHPGDFWLNEMLGVALMEIDRSAEAAGYLRTAVALRPDSPGALSNLGACLNDQGNNTGAIAAYHKTIAMSPNHVTAHLRLGNALKDQGDLPGALAAYQKTIALRPDYEGGYNNVGLILNGQGDLPGAVAAYRKAIALKSDNPIPYYNLGLALEKQGDIPGAVAAYRKAIALKADYTHAHFALGRLLHKQGDFAALEELRRAWELGSKDSRWRDYFRQSLSMLTPAYVHWRQEDKAAADQAMADLWASPEFVDQLNFEAWRLRRDGHLEQARELRADVVEAAKKLYPHGDPRAAKYQSDYIQLLLAMQRYGEAATVAGDALQSLPSGEITSRLMILRSLVKLYEQWKKPEEAQRYRKLVTSTEAAILPAELTAASLDQLNLKAYQLRQHGLFEEALELRTGVVDGAKLLYPTGDPRLVKYQNDYVDLLIAMKRYEEAKTVADNVLNSLPAGETTSRLGILRSLAHLHVMWNKPEEAERYRNLVKSTEAAAQRATVQTTSISSETGKEPEPSAQSLNDQAWSLATAPDPQMRDPQTAVKQAQQAVTLAPNTPDFWNTLGVAQYRNGNFKEAIPSLMKYRELRTSDAEYSNPFFLAMAHQQLGNKDEALQWYNRAVEWMEKKQAKSAMMLRTRAEAAELLGIEKEP
jgi:tetratricopeptide (TPR) repeat protein